MAAQGEEGFDEGSAVPDPVHGALTDARLSADQSDGEAALDLGVQAVEFGAEAALEQ
ncbi:hypothetical protein Nans01_25850 [Nocardiopsis ansamitocini]|uniref:Uncharacterized protein n=1 Tax=Nocardiopsis ansamitocini TaxID=1670832 RepID=A0A9W6P711_9ACTN|nr:hypothetical protein Nans01_25850 [Nocardiopsis ansamitocini]